MDETLRKAAYGICAKTLFAEAKRRNSKLALTAEIRRIASEMNSASRVPPIFDTQKKVGLDDLKEGK